MPSDLKLAGLLPAEIADRYDSAIKRIEELPVDAPNMDLLADVLELMADLSDIAARALALPAPTQLSREVERLTSELDEARRFGGLGCDANAGGPHEIIKEGSYQFCGKCGETIRQPSLKERARAAEARAEAAESQLSREAQSRDEVVELRAALKPFAECADQVPADKHDLQYTDGWTFQVRDFRRARAALSKSEQKPKSVADRVFDPKYDNVVD